MHAQQSAGGSSRFPFRCVNLCRSSSQTPLLHGVSVIVHSPSHSLFADWLCQRPLSALYVKVNSASSLFCCRRSWKSSLSAAKWAGRRNERTLTNTVWEKRIRKQKLLFYPLVQVLLLLEEVLRRQMCIVNLKYTKDLRYPSRCPLFAVTWSNDPWRRWTLAVSDVTIPPVIHNTRQF